jgi:hypothetical protein
MVFEYSIKLQGELKVESNRSARILSSDVSGEVRYR